MDIILLASASEPSLVTFSLPWPLVLGSIISVVLPILVGLVTTKVTNSSTKAVLLALLAMLTGLGTELLESINTGTSYDLGNALVFWLGSFAVAVSMHFGFWKSTGASAKVQDVLVTAKDKDGTHRVV